MVAETSVNGYIASFDKHEVQKVELLKELAKSNGMTRRMLSVATGIETSTVSARINDLIKQGRVIENGKDKCPITNVTVKWCFFNKSNELNKRMMK